MARWLTPWTVDPEVGVRAPLGSLCSVLEQDIFTPKNTGNTQEPRLRPNMTEKLFTGMLSIKPNQIKTSHQQLRSCRTSV